MGRCRVAGVEPEISNSLCLFVLYFDWRVDVGKGNIRSPLDLLFYLLVGFSGSKGREEEVRQRGAGDALISTFLITISCCCFSMTITIIPEKE